MQLPLIVPVIDCAMMSVHHLKQINRMTFLSMVTAANDHSMTVKALMQLLFVLHEMAPVVHKNKSGITRNAQSVKAFINSALFFIYEACDEFLRSQIARRA